MTFMHMQEILLCMYDRKHLYIFKIKHLLAVVGNNDMTLHNAKQLTN